MCAKYYSDAKGKLTLDDIRSSDLLFLDERFRVRADWRTFFERMGTPLTSKHERITFSDQQALLASAMRGQGVGLAWLGMADHLLAIGSLVRPVDVEVRTTRAFFLVAPRGAQRTGMATKFRDWMIEEGAMIQAHWEKSRQIES